MTPSSSSIRILGLDLATTTGWCLMADVQLPQVAAVYGPDSSVVIPVATTGRFTLPDPVGLNRADRAMRQYAAFGNSFRGLLERHEPDVVAYEYSSAPRSRFGNANGRASASVEFTVMRQLSLIEGFLIAYSNELIPHYRYRLVGIGTSEIHEHYCGAAATKKPTVWRALEALYNYDLSSFSADEKDAVAITRFAFEFLRRTEVAHPGSGIRKRRRVATGPA